MNTRKYSTSIQDSIIQAVGPHRIFVTGQPADNNLNQPVVQLCKPVTRSITMEIGRKIDPNSEDQKTKEE